MDMTIGRCIGTTSPTVVSSLAPAEMAAILEIKYRFAYRIRVENVSEDSVQLLGRYWCIKELTADGKDDDSKEEVVVDSPATGAGTSAVLYDISKRLPIHPNLSFSFCKCFI